ncbi:MAG: ABC transporter ATP-binding protein [Acidimicrobiia bacterium]|nr:ABC transporter ATP-binding protein [Acidimicrobiia bacterium]
MQSIRRLLRAAGVVRLVPVFLVAAAVGALIDVLTIALLAQAAVALTSGASKVHLAGPLSFLEGTSPDTLVVIGLCLCAARLVPFWVNAWIPAKASAHAQERLRRRLVTAYLHAPLLDQLAVRDGQLQELASTDTTQAANAALFVLLMVGSGVTLAILVGGAIVLSPVAASVVIVALAVLFVALRPLALAIKRSSGGHAQASLTFMENLNEAASLAIDSRTYGVVDAEEEVLADSLRVVRRPWYRVQLLHGLVPGSYQTAGFAFVFVGLSVVAASKSASSFGNLGAVVLLLVRALAASQVLQYGYGKVGEALPFLDRIFRDIERLEATHVVRGTEPLAHIETLRLDGVSFEYTDGRQALSDVDLEICQRESVAVSGPSGAGKSTLVGVLLGLLPPTVGSFRVNGVAVNDIAPADWSHRLGYVAQEGHLLTGTVAENIRFLREDISDDDVVRAAQAAHLHDEVLHWPSGYDTRISQRSEAVSGGQRQRICLARALVHRPDLLILDEPTSALDAEAEGVVADTLVALKGTVTMVIVSHKPAMTTLCDRVVRLRQGEVVGDTALDTAPSGGQASASAL